jgi:hypothetical protein
MMSSLMSDCFLFIISLNLGNSRSYTVTGWESRLIVVTWEYFTHQKVVDGKWLVAGHIVVMEHPTIPPFLWYFLSDSLFQELLDFFVKCWINRSTSGNRFRMNNSFHVKTSETTWKLSSLSQHYFCRLLKAFCVVLQLLCQVWNRIACLNFAQISPFCTYTLNMTNTCSHRSTLRIEHDKHMRTQISLTHWTWQTHAHADQLYTLNMTNTCSHRSTLHTEHDKHVLTHITLHAEHDKHMLTQINLTTCSHRSTLHTEHDKHMLTQITLHTEHDKHMLTQINFTHWTWQTHAHT